MDALELMLSLNGERTPAVPIPQAEQRGKEAGQEGDRRCDCCDCADCSCDCKC